MLHNADNRPSLVSRRKSQGAGRNWENRDREGSRESARIQRDRAELFRGARLQKHGQVILWPLADRSVGLLRRI